MHLLMANSSRLITGKLLSNTRYGSLNFYRMEARTCTSNV